MFDIMGDSHVLQGDNGRCLYKVRYTYVIRRGVEDVWHKKVAHLLQGQGEQVFIVNMFHF